MEAALVARCSAFAREFTAGIVAKVGLMGVGVAELVEVAILVKVLLGTAIKRVLTGNEAAEGIVTVLGLTC